MSLSINVTNVSEICANFNNLASLPSDQRAKAITTLARAILPRQREGVSPQDIHQISIPGTDKTGAAAIEHALTRLRELAVGEERKWSQLRQQLDKYVPTDPDGIDWAKQPPNAWILLKTETGYAIKMKGADGQTPPPNEIPLQSLLTDGLAALHVNLKDYAGSPPTTIFGIKLDTTAKKVAAVGIALLVVATPMVAVGALLMRGGAAPQPTPRERPVPRLFEPLDVNDTDLATCQHVVQMFDQTPLWEGVPRPLPTTHWEYSDLQRRTGFEKLSPLDQVQEAAGFTILTQQLGPETPTSVLQKVYNEGSARIRALQKSAEQVQKGAQKLKELEDSTIKVGSALLKRFRTDLEKTLQSSAKSIENIEEVFISTSDQLKRTERLLKKMRPFLDPQEITDTEKFIAEHRERLKTWKEQQTTPLKKRWDAELKSLKDECSKAADIDAVEKLVARLKILSNEIEAGARVFEASTLDPLKAEITSLRGGLSKEIATKQAAKYREASIDTLSEMATSLIDNPQEEPKANPYLKRQTEALRSLPEGDPQREYYRASLKLQQDFDTCTRTIAKHLSLKPLTATSVEFLRANLQELDEINTKMLKFYKTKEAKADSQTNLEPFRTAFVGVKLAVAKEVTNSLETMWASDRASVRPWIKKVLDDISPAVEEHLPDHQETIAKLRTMAEGTGLGRFSEWWAKKASEAPGDLLTPKPLNRFNRQDK
jgi:hypothetical protein